MYTGGNQERTNSQFVQAEEDLDSGRGDLRIGLLVTTIS